MNGIVACTITSETTDISCVIRIFKIQLNVPTYSQKWEKIGGHLFDKCQIEKFSYGDFGHWTNGGGKLSIVGEVKGFAAPLVPVGPIVFDDTPEPWTIAELIAVPTDFLDSVTPQNTVRGVGKLLLTQEKLKWSMWFRTA